jgi:hypothetical protein
MKKAPSSDTPEAGTIGAMMPPGSGAGMWRHRSNRPVAVKPTCTEIAQVVKMSRVPIH